MRSETLAGLVARCRAAKAAPPGAARPAALPPERATGAGRGAAAFRGGEPAAARLPAAAAGRGGLPPEPRPGGQLGQSAGPKRACGALFPAGLE